jgi:hypothetical protein
MKIPNTCGYRIVPFQVSESLRESLRDLRAEHLCQALEAWATEGLKPKQAVIGNYTIGPDVATSRQTPVLGQFWIIRHNDYDTGRARIDLQLRETENGDIIVWNSSDDRLTRSRLVESMVTDEYVRVENLKWFQITQLKYDRVSLESAPPAIREAELFDQCWAMGKALSAWLASNLTVIVNRGEEPTLANPALSRFLKFNLVYYAMAPDSLQYAKDYLNNPDLPDPRSRDWYLEVSKLRGQLRRSNRIATAEQLSLYQRLKDSYDYIQGLDQSERPRPIHVANLVGLQTKWINAVAEPIKSFMK